MLNFATFNCFSIKPIKSKTMVFNYENVTNELLPRTELNKLSERDYLQIYLQITHILTL